MSFKFTVSDIIPASPRAIYDSWLDSKAHGLMSGGKAKVSDKVGAAFTAWDNYISGVNLALVPGKRIVQSWRSVEFTDGDTDSKLTVTLKPVAGGTRLTLLHSSIPDSQKDGGYKAGWVESYFEPMKAYFAKAAKKPKAKRPKAKKPKAKKPKAKK
jgi:uncharacterized protein YndB with AHSA1/START domain